MSIASSRLIYAAFAGVAAIEAAVFACIFFPKVTPAYRDYFITRTSNCWERATSTAYPLGQPIAFGADVEGIASDPFRVCGWSGVETWGTWTEGGRASLMLRLPPDAPALRMRTKVRSFGEQSVEVRANQRTVARWRLIGDEREFSVLIPSKIARSGDSVRIDFLIANPRAPRDLGLSSDPRRLGIGVSRVVLERQ